ncbi:MAG TPA: DNA-binding response regulator [Acholeplasmatales bacterium]|nr:MAG: DNA-binding response regulator [Tenericutes bacterium GWF2_57_13]HAQ56490.1 DNA-binding response regulator [Acholeplasmatales bacterium]
MNERILVIEDDDVIARFLHIALNAKGYEVVAAETGVAGVAFAAHASPAVILLDLGLPDIDGTEVIRQIRAGSAVPIIVVSARDKEREKVEALDLGADDYLTKPFSVGELMARIRVALRKSAATPDTEEPITFGDLTIRFDQRRVLLRGEEIHLTPIEYKLLTLLITHPGKVLTHSYIQNAVWGYASVDDYQSLRVFMAAVRRKIEDDSSRPKYIMTEIGVGYRMLDEWVP